MCCDVENQSGSLPNLPPLRKIITKERPPENSKAGRTADHFDKRNAGASDKKRLEEADRTGEVNILPFTGTHHLHERMLRLFSWSFDPTGI